MLDKITAGTPDDAMAVTAATTAITPSASRALPWGLASALAVVAVALSIPAVRHLRETPPLETRVDIVTPASAQPTSFALSPDGRQIVFVASDDKVSRLWLRSLSTTAAQPLTDSEGAVYPFWSPDGDSVGFFAGGALKRLDLGGGAAQTLAPAANGRGGTWNADGVIVFAPNLTSPLMRVSATGGAATPVTTLGPQHAGHLDPQFLPDGRRLLFTVDGAADVNGIYLGGLDGGSPTQLASVVSSGVYAPAGWLLWVRAGSLIAQRLDVQRPALTGEPVALADGVDTDSIAGRIAVSVAATGMVAYRTGGRPAPTGMVRPLGHHAGRRRRTDQHSPSTSRVSRWPSRGRGHHGARQPGYLAAGWRSCQPLHVRSGSRPLSCLVAGQHADRVQVAARHGSGALYSKLTSGAGVEEQFAGHRPVPGPHELVCGRPVPAVSRHRPPDERRPLGSADERRGGRPKAVRVSENPFSRSLWHVFAGWPVGGLPLERIGAAGNLCPALHPARRNGHGYTAAGGQWQVSAAGGIHPLWRSDGKELYYINPDGAMMAAPITVTGNSLEPGAPVVLFPTRIYGGGADIQLGRQYDVTADGRFLINTVLNEAAAPITLLQNWNPDAKR